MSPTQQERSETTTGALVTAARKLFAADGYAATSLDAVVVKAGVTKGALYHHFAGKRDLFAAVFAAEQERIAVKVTEAAVGFDDPWEGFEAGCIAFVEGCQEPGVQRIFLLDAPAALGWETIRQIESGSMALMLTGIEAAVAAGRIKPASQTQLAHLLFGAICETAMVVARAPDQKAALSEATEELRQLLRGLAD